MGKGKPHLEFENLDLNEGWEVPPGYPEGMEQKVLTTDLDEDGKTGSRTRFLRIKPGVYSTAPFIHEHWEEVFLFEGDMIVGNDENGEGGEKFHAPTYACRPPGVYHGPFKSDGGCIMYENHYFYEADEE
jgi:hypothetical protein